MFKFNVDIEDERIILRIGKEVISIVVNDYYTKVTLSTMGAEVVEHNEILSFHHELIVKRNS